MTNIFGGYTSSGEQSYPEKIDSNFNIAISDTHINVEFEPKCVTVFVFVVYPENVVMKCPQM